MEFTNIGYETFFGQMVGGDDVEEEMKEPS